MHSPCQIGRPDWSCAYDTDQAAAAATRQRLSRPLRRHPDDRDRHPLRHPVRAATCSATAPPSGYRLSASHTLVRMTTATRTGVRTSAVWPVSFGVALLAGVIAAGLGAMSLADALTATGLPDPGPVTTYGLPFVRAAGEIAAVVARRVVHVRRVPGAAAGRTACSTPTDTGRCGWAPSRRRSGPFARRCWCR